MKLHKQSRVWNVFEMRQPGGAETGYGFGGTGRRIERIISKERRIEGLLDKSQDERDAFVYITDRQFRWPDTVRELIRRQLKWLVPISTVPTIIVVFSNDTQQTGLTPSLKNNSLVLVFTLFGFDVRFFLKAFAREV